MVTFCSLYMLYVRVYYILCIKQVYEGYQNSDLFVSLIPK